MKMDHDRMNRLYMAYQFTGKGCERQKRPRTMTAGFNSRNHSFAMNTTPGPSSPLRNTTTDFSRDQKQVLEEVKSKDELNDRVEEK